ncbi:methyl-accepting chemotaxis protein [Halomonas mongoliensis]|uniref:methyl-accepting chemotaxis protein n=1 Tax=Halomonas mongoliensis TaxID=321265 RepID=UPI00403AAEF0
MRLLTYCVALLAIAAAAGSLQFAPTPWGGWVALLFAGLAGALLLYASLLAVHNASAERLVSMGLRAWLPPLKDYLSLRRLGHHLVRRTGVAAIASAEVSHHADRLDQRLTRQESVVRDASSSMTAISSAIEQVASGARQVARLATDCREGSEVSREQLDTVIHEMQSLAARSSEALSQLGALEEKADSVKHVTAMIEEIAEQTNLLSLNASIEAARAGEHGRGFAVVAGEVRALAGRSAEATRSVESLVNDIGASIHQVVEDIGSLMGRVSHQAGEMASVGERLSHMTESVQGVEREIAEIATAMEDTRHHSQRIAGPLQSLSREVDEGNRDMHDLASQARTLMLSAEEVEAALAQQRLGGRHQRVYQAARQAADQLQALLEKALRRGELSMEQLFDTRYQPVPGTQPVKYRTRSDEFCDRHLPAIQEPLLEAYGLAYAICIDRNGYVPTHNLAVSRPPTGELEHDLKFSRSKRIFDDPTGQRCGSHREPLLLQTYKRDTGEVMHDLSVPLMVAGRHWGGFRLGYRPVAEGGESAPVAMPREGEWLQAESPSARTASPRCEAAPLS